MQAGFTVHLLLERAREEKSTFRTVGLGLGLIFTNSLITQQVAAVIPVTSARAINHGCS